MMMCKEAARLISESYQRPLGLGERVSLRVHLMMCKACRNFKEQARLIREAARRWNERGSEAVSEMRLSEEARRAIKAAMDAGPDG